MSSWNIQLDLLCLQELFHVKTLVQACLQGCLSYWSFMALLSCFTAKSSQQQVWAVQATHPNFSELPHHRSHSTSCSINQHCLSWLHPADLQQTKICSEAAKKRKEWSGRKKRGETQRCDLTTLNQSIITTRTRLSFPILWNTKLNPTFLIWPFHCHARKNPQIRCWERECWGRNLS